jgi:hypothetical protein
MAVTTQYGTEYTSALITKPASLVGTWTWHGRSRKAFVSHTQSGAGDANSTVTLFKIPPGSVRLIIEECYLYVNWTTALVDLNLGWGAYTGLDGTAVVADPNGIVDALDVDTAGVFRGSDFIGAAGAGLTAANGYTIAFQSKDGVDIIAQAVAAGLADADSLAGVLTYVQD